MRIVDESIELMRDGHVSLQTILLLQFSDTNHEEFVIVSTVYKQPLLCETYVFRTKDNMGKHIDFDKDPLFEWRGSNHARAIIECQKFESQTIDYILSGEKHDYGKEFEENIADLEKKADELGFKKW